MGLIKAALGAADGVMADQWKEFFYCDSLDKDTLAAKGQKRTSRGDGVPIRPAKTISSRKAPSSSLTRASA